jgi:hypothetical protein
MPRKSRRSSGRGGPPAARRPALTSVPTGRAAYEDTRQWLLAKFGPICAYCERKIPAGTVTLDHVTPRRGQTAFDRRDNLVLCCKTCNTGKADTSIQAFLLGNRMRAVNMFKYGQHLSQGLVDMARQLLPPRTNEEALIASAITAQAHKPVKPRARKKKSAELFGPAPGESPYQEDSPYAD